MKNWEYLFLLDILENRVEDAQHFRVDYDIITSFSVQLTLVHPRCILHRAGNINGGVKVQGVQLQGLC